jgi:NAD(P)-dependent dehydrogenase (short-subunit alcohol dehydrogenase family)
LGRSTHDPGGFNIVVRVRLALVTGASTGIGRATALQLARSSWTVLAGVRDPSAGERLLADAGNGRLLPLSLDVTDAAHVAAAAERVRELAAANAPGSVAGGLDALVNNAGIGVGGPLELVAADELRRQFEVNVFAQVAVTQALLPSLRKAGGRAAACRRRRWRRRSLALSRHDACARATSSARTRRCR